jgi:flagellar M-ring protein FliF
MNTGTQLQTTAQIEAIAAARVATLLIPLVGAGNFQTDVSANLDFTQEHIHQITYGPDRLISHQMLTQSMQTDGSSMAIGIPGALSNEPPQATTATPNLPAVTTGAKGSTTPPQPRQSSSNTDQTYAVDESDADITNPDWAVKSVAVSVVLNKAALSGGVTMDQVKTAIAGAFAYPNVSVNVLAASFQQPPDQLVSAPLIAAVPPLAQAVLEMMAAAALLFGFAVPAGRRLAAVNLQSYLPVQPRPMPVVLPPRDFSDLREQAADNIPGVARLLQNWAEDNE